MKILLTMLVMLFSTNLCAATIHTAIGDVDEKNPLILELIKSPCMQRLKHIDQSGPNKYFQSNFPSLSRYDHSLGVYALLKRFNASHHEQIAGLLHDASHTVFSHVGDIVFQTGDARTESYQDSIHAWFLEYMHVDTILEHEHISIQDIMPKNAEFTALEQPYPDMNADRIEYNLHTALILNDLNSQEVEEILKALHFKDNKWYFSDLNVAKKFARLSTYYTRSFWGAADNFAAYTITSAAIKYALKHKIITKDEMHFGIDEEIVAKLQKSNDPYLTELCNMLKNLDKYYLVSNNDTFDAYQPVKMRGIDPLVKQDQELKRLSEICFDFKNELVATKSAVKNGLKIKFTNIKDPTLLQMLKEANV